MLACQHHALICQADNAGIIMCTCVVCMHKKVGCNMCVHTPTFIARCVMAESVHACSRVLSAGTHTRSRTFWALRCPFEHTDHRRGGHKYPFKKKTRAKEAVVHQNVRSEGSLCRPMRPRSSATSAPLPALPPIMCNIQMLVCIWCGQYIRNGSLLSAAEVGGAAGSSGGSGRLGS